MALNLDPITGLPSDFLAPDLYQIPLNSRPQLAPEWSPDHLPPNALHPDNMPSMFATVQAQNSLNPGLPQALTTDGKGNLNVNAVGGGGSVPAGYGAVYTWTGWSSATSYFGDQYVDIHTRFTTMWKLTLISSLDTSSCSMNQPVLVRVYFRGQPSRQYFEYEAFIHEQRPAGTSINVCDVREKTIIYPGGWSNLPFFDTNDTRVEVHFQTDEGFLPLVYASIDYS